MLDARIFISYRRTDSAAYAQGLYDRLAASYGREQIFRDLDMDYGIDFVERIDETVRSCAVMLVVIGPRWLDARDESGDRRLDDPEDYVRIEVGSALKGSGRVIPVLVGDAKMPRRAELPDALSALARRNALRISDDRWHYDVSRLIDALSRVLEDREEKPAETSAPVDEPAATAATQPPTSPPLPPPPMRPSATKREPEVRPPPAPERQAVPTPAGETGRHRKETGITPPSVPNLEPGSLFAGYRIESVLDRGNVDVIYRATDPDLDRVIALKIIAPERTQDPTAVVRFKAEARLAASLEHPNIVPVHRGGECDGLLYLAMRLVPGTNLQQIIEGGPLDLHVVGHVVSKVADALDTAHERGLVHRDVKPANILLSGAGSHQHVYLTGFGLTNRLGSTGGLTRTSGWVGTPDYAAPEQIRGDAVNGRADVYSLGCVVYEMLTGHVAYPRDSPMAKLSAHLTDPPPLPRRERPDLAEAFDDVVARAMAKEPGDRYGTAGKVAAALEVAISQQEDKGRRDAEPDTAPREVAPTASPNAPAAATNAPAAAANAPAAPAQDETVVNEPVRPVAMPSGEVAGISAQQHEGAPAAPTDGSPAVGEQPPRRVSAAASRSSSPVAPPGRVRRRRAQLWPIAAVGVVLAAVAAVIVVSGRGGERTPATPTHGARAATTPGSTATTRRQATGPFAVGGGPDGIAVGAGAVWVAASRGGRLTRIDPVSGATSSVDVGPNPDSVVVAFGSVWVSVTGANSVVRVTAGERPKVLGAVDVGLRPEGIAASGRAIWVANSGDGTVTQINASTGVARTVPGVGRNPVDLEVGAGAVWVADSAGATLARVDGGRHRLAATIGGIGPNPRAVAVVGRDVWVVTAGDGRVWRVHGDANAVAGSVRVGGSPRGIATDGKHLWVSDHARDRLVEIDPAAMRVAGSRAVAGGPIGVAVDDHALWVAGFDDGQVKRIPH